MKAFQDGFGREIYDYFRNAGGFEIVERDDGYIALSGGPRAYFSEYKDWPAHQRQAMKYARGRVLDIGCGAGRHSLHLQRKGLDVTGIDLSPLAVKVCKQRGLKQAYVLPIARIHPRLGEFDTILMMGNNFGLFESFDRARRLLRRFHKMSAPNARIIAESRDPYETKDPHHLAYHALNRRRGRMPGQLRIRVRYKKYASPWFDYLLASKEEMKKILSGIGWKVKRFIGSADASYIAIIEKGAKT
jgi:SAM-dependent methyltransferase